MKGIRLAGTIFVLLLALGSSIALADQAEVETQGLARVAPDAEGLPGRTASSETLGLPDGRLETRIYTEPVNYRDEEGHWRPIGEGLHETSEQTLVNGPNGFDVTLPKQIDAKPVRFEVGEEWVESQLLRKGLEGAELEGGSATYEGEGSAPSFAFTGLGNGLKEEIELSAPGQANTYTYELSASEGLRPSLAEDGSVQFSDSEGKTAVVLPAPVMSDSAGAQSRAAHYELGPEEEGHWELSVIADRDWLADPARVYPVRIDPTMTVGSALECVIGGHKAETGWIDCSAWGREHLVANYIPKLNSAEDSWQRTLMNFETKAIPPTASISSAAFHAYSYEAAQNTTGVELRKVTKPWTWEASWSRYDGPSHLWTTEGGDYSETLGEVLTSKRGSQGGWWEFPLPTKALEEEATEGTDLPVMMKLIDDKVRECGKTSCINRQITFDSGASEYVEDRPYLSVVYSVPSSETPIAEYSFNEGSGETAHDGSGHGHEGTLHGAKWSTEGRYGGALSFDGKSALLTVPSSKELELSRAFTLEAWANPEEANPWSAILVKEVPGWASYELHAEAEHKAPAGFLYDSYEDEAAVEGTSAIPTKAWSYLALTSDGTDLRLYVNGKLAGTSAAVYGAGGKGPLQIGGDLLWGEGDAFKGRLDNIRLYNRTLSEAEVKTDEGRAVGAKAPTATSEAAGGLGATAATLKGSVNPNGSATTYQFEYGTTTAYGTKAPASPESVGSGSTAVAESKAITGLKEGTTYHFRITATSEGGTSYGEDKTFTTLKLPSATTEAASEIKEHQATVKASVNPSGSATTYQFEWGTTTSYGTKTPASPESVGSETTAVALSKAIGYLEEGTTYHYRVVATSAAGIANGADKTLKTTHPPQTTITSPTPSYTNHEEQPVKFESSQAGSTFKCGFDEGETPTKSCTSPFVLPEHLSPGWHAVVIAAVNSEGQADQTPAEWDFNTDNYHHVGTSAAKFTSPGEGAKSGSYFTLTSEWELVLEGGNVSSVAYELMAPSWKEFKPIPAQYLWNAEGGHPDWALKAEKGTTKAPPLYFDIRALAEAEGWPSVVEGLQLRAVFNGGYFTAGATDAVNVTYSRFGGGPGDAVEQVGRRASTW